MRFDTITGTIVTFDDKFLLYTKANGVTGFILLDMITSAEIIGLTIHIISGDTHRFTFEKPLDFMEVLMESL